MDCSRTSIYLQCRPQVYSRDLKIDGACKQFSVVKRCPVCYSWVSLGYFAVNLSGGQPKMY